MELGRRRELGGLEELLSLRHGRVLTGLVHGIKVCAKEESDGKRAAMRWLG